MPFSGVLNVLLIDECALDAYSIQRSLRQYLPGAKVQVCEQLAELTEQIESMEQEPDIVICASTFCSVSASEIHRLISVDGICAPFLLLFEADFNGIIQAALPKGVDDYLLKDNLGNYLDLLPVLMEKMLSRKDGENAILISEPVSSGDQDIGSICESDQWRDLPHRVHMEREVLRLRSWLAALIANRAAGVVVELEDGRIGMANEPFCRMLGLDETPYALIGRPFSLVLESRRTLFRRPDLFLARIALGDQETEQIASEEWSLADGRILELDLTPVKHRSGIKGRIWSFHDITRRKREEKALRWATRMEATSTLAGGIAHDFNNLMLAVLGNAELLKSRVDHDVSAARMLESITEAARRAGDLSQKMLAYARGGRYQPCRMNLNSTVEDVIGLWENGRDPKVRLEVHLEPQLHSVKADAGQLDMVLAGLLANASEAIESGGSIQVSTANVEFGAEDAAELQGLFPGPHVVMAVKDSGCGMDEGILSRIFEPYFSTKFQGRGLGLAAVYGIVKNHAGHIQVTSSPGLGTLFRIYLPSVEAAKSIEARASEPLKTEYTRGDETILLIDDDDMVLNVLQENLETQGFKVLKARDGEEALRIARTHPDPIDLAILDMGMPGMDGAEVFPLLETVRPDMRVLICSGYEMDRTSSAMLKQGASGFLPKPFEMSRLVPEVHKALSRKD